jgi:two-component system, OmpR family, phosphate regulon response regulator PhoB
MKTHIVVVEHDADLVLIVRKSLEAEGYRVSHVASFDDAMRIIVTDPPALVIAGTVPLVSPIDLLGCIRAQPRGDALGVIMLSRTGEDAERIEGLSSGADDYVASPFSHGELTQRSKAVIRRTRPAGADTLRFRDIELDRSSHEVRRGLRKIRLSPTNFRLLEVMLDNPGRLWTRPQLVAAAWPHVTDSDERTVDVHIGRLRKALTRHEQRDVISTVRGVGYKLRRD